MQGGEMKKIALVLALVATTTLSSVMAKEVTIYSVYGGDRLDNVFKPFTDKTGIKVNIVSGTSLDLIKKIKDEAENTIADLHIDKDLVYHTLAVEQDLYQPFDSKLVENNILPSLIESNKNWFTVVYRARIIVYNENRVNASELSTYEDLGNEKWNKRLCLRTSNNSYNEALGAFFVKHFGKHKTTEVFTSWVNNLAIDPIKGDSDAIKTVADGVCDVAVVNSYYLAPFIKENPNYPVKAFFPNQNTIGSHLNGVGIGLVKHAKNIKEATLVMEYLSSKEVQAPLAQAFSQYPANPNAELSPVLKGFGTFKADQTNVGEIGKFINEARIIMKEAEYK